MSAPDWLPPAEVPSVALTTGEGYSPQERVTCRRCGRVDLMCYRLNAGRRPWTCDGCQWREAAR
ncbi:MAG: hypothetical protein OXJ62_14160 [Spirochaetaceae bacterium]|nr:hypothetical protein [Spirochaetaceae bacterium]